VPSSRTRPQSRRIEVDGRPVDVRVDRAGRSAEVRVRVGQRVYGALVYAGRRRLRGEEVLLWWVLERPDCPAFADADEAIRQAARWAIAHRTPVRSARPEPATRGLDFRPGEG
jgi:hypothetical protein